MGIRPPEPHQRSRNDYGSRRHQATRGHMQAAEPFGQPTGRRASETEGMMFGTTKFLSWGGTQI